MLPHEVHNPHRLTDDPTFQVSMRMTLAQRQALIDYATGRKQTVSAAAREIVVGHLNATATKPRSRAARP
jgi:hypothetical protein